MVILILRVAHDYIMQWHKSTLLVITHQQIAAERQRRNLRTEILIYFLMKDGPSQYLSIWEKLILLFLNLLYLVICFRFNVTLPECIFKPILAWTTCKYSQQPEKARKWLI